MKYVFPILFFLVYSCGQHKLKNHDYKNVSEYIKVTSPQPFDEVNGVLNITGEARGNYFFEANFPIELELENGEIIQHYATAQGEWMTTEFVPFEAEIDLSHLPNQKIFLKLIQANPSGDERNQMKMKIPLKLVK